jgi:hypothetical protein
MVCGDSVDVATSIREVRFWGKIALSASTDPKMLQWRCVKNEKPDPDFTCRKLSQINGSAF